MNSKILSNINSFIKKRLIEAIGVLLIFLGLYLLVIIASYSPNDPNFIYNSDSTKIANAGVFYGSVISDFLLQSLGLIAILFVFNWLTWGFTLIKTKAISNFSTKLFYTFLYLVFGTTALNITYNTSYWLIDNGNGGFVGRIIKENIYYFTPLIENEYIIYFFILITIIFFVLSLSLAINKLANINL